MPLVVIDAEISISTSPREQGKPIAIGLGVKTACVPPKGATLADAASELARIIISPSRAARIRNTARQAMW